MNLTSYVLEQALKQLQLPDSSIKQFRIASSLSDVGGRGFPKELFQLSAPLVVRGLLNFGTLQMRSDWVYPYWVHRQLDPRDESYVPRSQNPLLLNVTHRNWTMLGTPNGAHEAIVDPRGLATPLPREWSVDAWVATPDFVLFPSLAEGVTQRIDPLAPRLTTVTETAGLRLTVEQFVGSTNRNLDVLFQRSIVRNLGAATLEGFLCIAIRPFNPEGVAPIHAIEFRHRRFAYVNNVLGVAFAQEPDWVRCSNAQQGDVSNILRSGAVHRGTDSLLKAACPVGLSQAIAAFPFSLDQGKEHSVDCSVALGTERSLHDRHHRSSWRVSFEQRKERHEDRWKKELSSAATFELPDPELQDLFDASRSTLLELHDGEFMSPGPYLYHHFWFRDAAPMVRALDDLGFQERAKKVIDAFPKKLTSEGYFRGPDGEWDSNGLVLWLVREHYLMTRSRAWLQEWYLHLLRAGEWLIRTRKKSTNLNGAIDGLMPPSLSAEHLGTVDQYFWDSFWSLAGIRALAQTAGEIGTEAQHLRFIREYQSFETDLQTVIHDVGERIGHHLIPSSPSRPFDESAIGSIAAVYPLQILTDLPHPANTVEEILRQFTDDRGFFHPIIHSGYNPYLTMQLAHSALFLGRQRQAWETADAVFRQAKAPFSLPEAIHPRTGGGVMGDGHHGWAAAEIVLFIRDCLVREQRGKIMLFDGAGERLVRKGSRTKLKNVPTQHGLIDVTFDFESTSRCVVELQHSFDREFPPTSIDIVVPFRSTRVSASIPGQIKRMETRESSTLVSCLPSVRTLFIDP